MNINRHNYEEFFLLYVDNELTEAERAEVKAFVQQQPDLAEELSLLQSSLLTDDHIQFEHKETLYKNEQAISLANYEAYFIEYVNNELQTSEKSDVEKFVLQHPKLQDEFTLLQQTKLQPELIEFENKASLYRRIEKRVIPITFLRMAAAAAIIGLVTTLWITYNNSNKFQPVAGLQPEKESITNHDTQVVKKHLNEIAALDKPPAHIASSKKKNISVESLEEIALKENASKKTSTHLIQLPVTENNSITVINNPKKDNIKTVIEEPAQNVQIEDSKADPHYAINNINATQDEGSLTHHAVYKELDNNGDEDQSIYIGGTEINKNKLRGLFKKAANFFEKKTRKMNGDYTVQVASFELKTK